MLTYGIPPEFRGGVHMKLPYAIGSVPSLSGHAIAYRWRSLPRVRRHRASKPQGSSERVLSWQITMDQLIFASLSHTHYWYKVYVCMGALLAAVVSLVVRVRAVCLIAIRDGHCDNDDTTSESPPKTGTNLSHFRPPPIVERPITFSYIGISCGIYGMGSF